MKRARIAWAGAIHDAVEADGQLELLTPALRGRRVSFDEVIWLPPLAPPEPAAESPTQWQASPKAAR